MKRFVTIICVSCFVLAFGSCYYDKADVLYPTNTICDTTGTISYAVKIVPLFQQQCYGCHTGSAPSGNVLMGTYAADRAIANSGRLYGSINQVPGYSFMPKGGLKMSKCQLASIKKWIDSGTPNN
jgi:hypothetical protein